MSDDPLGYIYEQLESIQDMIRANQFMDAVAAIENLKQEISMEMAK